MLHASLLSEKAHHKIYGWSTLFHISFLIEFVDQLKKLKDHINEIFADDFLKWYQSKSMGFFLVFLKAFAGYNFDLLELESVSGLQNYVIKKCFSNLIPNQLPKIYKGLFKVTNQKCYFKSAHVDITCKAHVFVHVWIVLGRKKNYSFTRAIFSIRKVYIFPLVELSYILEFDGQSINKLFSCFSSGNHGLQRFSWSLPGILILPLRGNVVSVYLKLRTR